MPVWYLRALNFLEQLQYYSFSSWSHLDRALHLALGCLPEMGVLCDRGCTIRACCFLMSFPAASCLGPPSLGPSDHLGPSRYLSGTPHAGLLFLEGLPFLFNNVLFIQRIFVEVLKGKPPIHHLDGQKSLRGNIWTPQPQM